MKAPVTLNFYPNKKPPKLIQRPKIWLHCYVPAKTHARTCSTLRLFFGWGSCILQWLILRARWNLTLLCSRFFSYFFFIQEDMIILLLQVLLIFIHNPNLINSTDRKDTRIIFKLRNEPNHKSNSYFTWCISNFSTENFLK